jgi:hypothetical protein
LDARREKIAKKILDHPGIVVNEPIGALTHLGLARAHALSGENFFALWKDAALRPSPNTPS